MKLECSRYFAGYIDHISSTVYISDVRNRNSFKANALWDTGARSCAISKKVYDELALNFLDTKQIHCASGPMNVAFGVTMIKLSINGREHLIKPIVLDNIMAGKYDVVIGMSLIRQGDFHLKFNPDENKTEFEFYMPD